MSLARRFREAAGDVQGAARDAVENLQDAVEDIFEDEEEYVPVDWYAFWMEGYFDDNWNLETVDLSRILINSCKVVAVALATITLGNFVLPLLQLLWAAIGPPMFLRVMRSSARRCCARAKERKRILLEAGRSLQQSQRSQLDIYTKRDRVERDYILGSN